MYFIMKNLNKHKKEFDNFVNTLIKYAILDYNIFFLCLNQNYINYWQQVIALTLLNLHHRTTF